VLRRLFVNANIAFLFLGQVISEAGDSMFRIALLWMVLDLTGSRSLTGLMASASFLPFLLFALPAGALADRVSRKKIMIFSDGARILLVLTVPVLYLSGHLTMTLLGLLTFAVATFAAVFYPARDASVPDLSPPASLAHANALIQTSWQFALLLGPAAAAVLIPLTGIVHLFSVDAVTFLLSLLFVAMLRPRPEPEAEPAAQAKSGVMGDMTEGVRFAAKDPLTRIVLIVAALDNLILMGPAIVGIPIFVRDVLHLGPTHYAWAEAALAGGIILGAPLTAFIARRVHLGRLLLWGVILDGITYLPLFFIRSFTLTIIAIAFHSIFIPLVTVSRTTLIQTYVPPRLRGRIFSLVLMCVIGGTAISSLLTGLISEVVPMPTVFLFMALLAASSALPGFLAKSIHAADGSPLRP